MLDTFPEVSYCAAMRTNGAALRALREAHGWQATKFATAVLISPSYLSNIEAGRKQASPKVLRAMADVLDVPLAAITSDFEVGDVA